VSDPNMGWRSIGVVSLLADKQALLIWERLTDELGTEVIQRHNITCGDARTFQGKERNIMFLSMVSARNEVGAPLSRDTFAQRFNVAASCARDRMYLVRSVTPEDLSKADRYRLGLIAHFATPFAQDEERVEDLRKLCESDFEREMYDELTQRGYRITPQVRVGQYRIDMVVQGHNDARLAIECDGNKYHGADKWADDMQRQRVLERAGWVFWRCFASAFIRRRKDTLDDLMKTLAERGIDPIGGEDAPRSVHTEHRVVPFVNEPTNEDSLIPVEVHESVQTMVPAAPPEVRSSAGVDTPPVKARLQPSTDNGDDLFDRGRVQSPSIRSRDAYLPLNDYAEYAGPAGNAPRGVSATAVAEDLIRIVEVEGPVVAKRACDIYLRGCGIKRMGHELKITMNKALEHGIHQQRLVSESEGPERGPPISVVRVTGSPPIKLRTRGPRSFEEIPPSELQVVARYLLTRHRYLSGSDEHLRAVLECFDLKRLTTQAGMTLLEVLERSSPYVDEHLNLLYLDS